MPREPDVERSRVYDSILSLLSELTLRSPTLVVIEDLHCADQLSLVLLLFIARRLAPIHVSIVATLRSSPSDAQIPQIGSLHRLETTRLLPLKSLGHRDVELLLDCLGWPGHLESATALCERSGGNPFFLSQLMRAAHARSDSPGDDRAELPQSVRAAILEQAAGLSLGALSILKGASVLGREFSVSVLARQLGSDPRSLVGPIEEASRRGLLDEVAGLPDRSRFRHDLVREVLYAEIARGERCQLHLRAARALESREDDAEPSRISLIANHLRAAVPFADPSAVAVASIEAAEYAIARLAFDEAQRHCTQALYALQTSSGVAPQRKAELLLTLARAQLRAGLRASGRESLRSAASLAREHELTESFVASALAISPPFFSIETGVVDAELIGALEEALQVIPDCDSPPRAKLLGQLAMALYWSPERRRSRQASVEALEMAERTADPVAVWNAIAASCVALWCPESLEDRLAKTLHLSELAKQIRDESMILMASVFRLTTLLEAGSSEAAAEEEARFSRLAAQTRHPHVQWYPPMYRAMRAILHGRFADAQTLMQEFLEIGRRFDDVNVVQTFLLQSAEICWWTGRASQILTMVGEHIRRFPHLREWDCALAFLLACSGSVREARARAVAVVESDGPNLVTRMNGPIAVAALTEVAVRTRDADLAARLLPLVDHIGDRVIVAGYSVCCWGSFSRAVGHVASALRNWPEAEKAYRKAMECDRRIGAVAWLARSRIAFATMVVERGEARGIEEARECAREGLAVAREIGAAILEAEAFDAIERLERMTPGEG